ncbi:MAG: M23 family metallopeptidase [Bacteroidales bacterium]|jgi:murein DD-endopeptidase MepM/ murein hydrolase activator NlpD|nr:M23 family metallopeptidase [Bacteroidales bacterium]MDD4058418.1 M23 family metallopeptidase [Bacteroidales bacterium]
MSKYKFNKDQLKFVEDKLGIKGKLRIFLGYLIGSILLAILYYIIAALFINTREEERLLREREMMEQEYKNAVEKMNLLEDVLSDLQTRDREIYMNIFKSLPPDLVNSAYDAAVYEHLDSLEDMEVVKFSAQKSAEVEELVKKAGDKLDLIYNEFLGADNATDIPSILPIERLAVNQTGASLGMKIHPFYKTMQMHNGVDLLAAIGTEVVAVANGVVVEVTRSDRGRGNQIVIEHWGGYKTVYSHLGDMLVRKSQQVKQGSVIGRVGNSGLSFAPHLHFEVHLDGRAVEPVNYFFADLSPREYREMLMISLNTGQSLD